MQRFKRLLAASLVTTLSVASPTPFAISVAAGTSSSPFIWTDKDGFVVSKDCKEAVRPDSRFRIVSNANDPLTRKFEFFLDAKWQPTAVKVPRYSIVKIIDEVPVDGMDHVEIVSIQPGLTESGVAETRAKGYLPIASLDYITNYTIQLNGQVGGLPGSTAQVAKSFLEATAGDSRGYTVYSCGGKDYSAFTLKTGRTGETPIVVGVQWLQTNVLRKAHVYFPEVAKQMMAEKEAARLQVERQAAEAAEAQRRAIEEKARAEADKKTAEGNYLMQAIISWTGGAERARARAKAQEELAASQIVAQEPVETEPTPTAVEEEAIEESDDDLDIILGDLQHVVCTKDKGLLNVRKMVAGKDLVDGSKDGVIFQVDQFEEAMPVQSFDGDSEVEKVSASGERYIYVQFPNVIGELNRGWVSKDFVIPSDMCLGFQRSLGGNQPLICTKDDPLSVWKDDLKTKMNFKANRWEEVSYRSDWEEAKKVKDGKTYVPVRFILRSSEYGWVDSAYVKSKDGCEPYVKAGRPEAGAIFTGSQRFPTLKRPSHSYLTYPRHFGASGPGRPGRKHAACDLYRIKGEVVYATKPGVVIQGAYSFAKPTAAVEVKNDDGTVIRYAEIQFKEAIAAGKRVKVGDKIGIIGQVKTKRGWATPMLHFELYSGKRKGTLSGGGQYKRRSDLIDPTKILQALEKKTFGSSF